MVKLDGITWMIKQGNNIIAGLSAEELAQRMDIHVDIVKRSLASLKEKCLVVISYDRCIF